MDRRNQPSHEFHAIPAIFNQIWKKLLFKDYFGMSFLMSKNFNISKMMFLQEQ